MKTCCDRNADNKACDCPRCPRCSGRGELSCSKCSGEGCSPHGLATNGPCTAGDTCPECGGVGKVPAAPDDSLPPPVSWADWLAGCDGVVMPVVVLTEEPALRQYAQGDSTVYGLRNGGRCLQYYDKGKSPGDSEILAELLALDWPGVEFRWPGKG